MTERSDGKNLIKYLLQNYDAEELVSNANINGNTPLHNAVRCNKKWNQVVQLLIDNGADVNAENDIPL